MTTTSKRRSKIAPKGSKRGPRRQRRSHRLLNIVRTLLINGYTIEAFERPAAEISMIRVRKRDALGAEARTVLLFADSLSSALLDRLTGEATRNRSTPTFVSMKAQTKTATQILQLSLAEFYDILGGEIRTDRVLDPKLHQIMDDLGHNRLPPSFAGKPDDLLEAYSEECLEFLLECPVRRYGQERRFEPLPDGLALGRNRFNLYFDAKAYADEFHPSADDIRRFVSYVQDFNLRYASHVGSISLFLVISGSFSKDRAAIVDKINEFYAASSTPMAFIKAVDLADAVRIAAASSKGRAAINWRRVLVPQLFEPQRLKDEIARIAKDKIVH